MQAWRIFLLFVLAPAALGAKQLPSVKDDTSCAIPETSHFVYKSLVVPVPFQILLVSFCIWPYFELQGLVS